jgi:hypothetical protein
MAEKKVWGIKIVPPKITREEALSQKKTDLRFETFIALGEEGQWFVTTEPAKAEIGSAPHLKSIVKNIGLIRFELDNVNKLIIDAAFFPLGFEGGHKLLKGRGLASLVEEKIIGVLAREYPKYNFRAALNPDWGRRKQYKKRGLKLHQQYPIAEYHQRIVTAIEADKEKIRLEEERLRKAFEERQRKKRKKKPKGKRPR